MSRALARQPARLLSLLPASRVLHSNPRAQGKNPRARRTNPRARGTNPRAFRLNPKALGQDCRQPTKPPTARRGLLDALWTLTTFHNLVGGEIETSRAELALMAGCHKRRVPELLAELERQGVALRTYTAGGRGRGLKIEILRPFALAEMAGIKKRPVVVSFRALVPELTKGCAFPLSPYAGSRSAPSGAAPEAVASHQNSNFHVAKASVSAEDATAPPCGRKKTALRAPPSVAEALQIARRSRTTREPEKFRRGMLMAIRWVLWARGASRHAASAAGWWAARAAELGRGAQGELRHELERLLRVALTCPAGHIAELGRGLNAWQRTSPPREQRPSAGNSVQSFSRPPPAGPAGGAEIQLPLWAQEFARRGAELAKSRGS